MKTRPSLHRRSVPAAIAAAVAAAALYAPPLAATASAAGPVTITWTDQSGDNQWNTTGIDWINGSTPTTYSDGANVVFSDLAGPGHYGVSLVRTEQPGAILVNASAGNYIFGGTGSINSTTTTLTKLGSGSLTIDNTQSNTLHALSIEEGTVVMDMSFMPTPTNLVTSSILQGSGGTLTIIGNSTAPSAQSFTALSPGQSGLFSISAQGTAGVTVALGSIGRTLGNTIDVNPLAGGSFTSLNSNTNGIIGGFITVASKDWAVSGGTGGTATPVTALATYTNDTWAAGDNTTVTTSSSPAADSTTNSLRFSAAIGATVTLSDTSTNFNLIQSGGILVTGNVGPHNVGINGGLLTSANGSDLIVIQNNTAGAIYIGSQIVNNGTSTIGLTISGVGTVVVSGINTYTGPTTINGAILSVNTLTVEGAGGVASSIGQSANLAGNLVLNQGTLRYTGTASTTDRLLTLGPGGGTLDSSGTGAISFSGTGPSSQIAIEDDTATVFTLTGNYTSSANTFTPNIPDPDTAGTYKTSVVISGNATWALMNANTYSGGTTVNSGVLEVKNISGSGTGTGPVVVSTGGTIGGSGSVGGPVTINSGGNLKPGDATNFTINNNLTLATGAILDYFLDKPNLVGPSAGDDDLTTVNGLLTINPNLTVNVPTVGSNFTTGTYTLIHYSTLADTSNNFQGWLPEVNWPAAPANTYYSFANAAGSDNINLLVLNSGGNPISLPPGQPPIGIPLPGGGNPANPINGNNPPPIIINPNPGGNGGPVRIGPINNNPRQNLGVGFIAPPNGPVNVNNANKNNINAGPVNVNVAVLAPVMNIFIAPKNPPGGQFVGFAYPVEWQNVQLPGVYAGANAGAAQITANTAIQNWMLTDSVGIMIPTLAGWQPSVYADIIPAGWGTESLLQSAALSPTALANGADPLNPRIPDPINTTFAAYLAGLPGGTTWEDIDGGWGVAATAAVAAGGGNWTVTADFWAIQDYDVQEAPAAPVPEPASLAILGLSSLALLTRRRRRT